MPRTATNRPNSKTPAPKYSPPLPRAPSPSPAPIQSSSPSMMDTMKQGFAFGVGSSIAHNIFDSKPNSKNKDENINKNEITNEPKLTTDKMYELYNKCLENNDRNIDCTTILQNNKQ
jgi:hypothetical protein